MRRDAPGHAYCGRYSLRECGVRTCRDADRCRGAISDIDCLRTRRVRRRGHRAHRACRGRGYAPFIVLSIINPPLVGALNARRKGIVLLAGGIINVSVNLVLTVSLGSLMGIIGVALSTSITGVIIATFFSQRVRRLDGYVRRSTGASGAGIRPSSPRHRRRSSAAWLVWSRWEDLGTLPGLAVLAGDRGRGPHQLRGDRAGGAADGAISHRPVSRTVRLEAAGSFDPAPATSPLTSSVSLRGHIDAVLQLDEAP